MTDLAALLRQWSETQLAALGTHERLNEEAARSGSLLRAPATTADVVAAEQRLGTRFPPSFRAFLLLSDGAYGDTMGPVTDNPPGESMGFLPAAELRWYRDVEPELVAMWVRTQDEIDEANGGPDLTPVHEYGEVRDHRPVRDALLIARGFDANCSLLVPVGGPGPGEEWEVWDHYKEGASRWSSFRAFLVDAVEEQVGVEADEGTTRHLLAATQAGDVRASIVLGRVRSPEAAPALMAAARDGIATTSVLQALARIGGPEVVAFLVGLDLPDWEERQRQHALATIGTPAALDHLAAVGGCYELARVGDPRGTEIAAAQLRSTDDVSTALVAASVLRAQPDPRWVPDLLVALDRATNDQLRLSVLGALQACGAHTDPGAQSPSDSR
ncbi:SMI1/KNR4 family protein [Nocardioides sp. R1-1]|uniref:SMI1/KNR4 family protein n=1 Tax=Nocardioides sp. R1-1 TaxID=3383502 RepID=UPI0038CFE7E1